MILRRRTTQATGRAERDTALEMVDDILNATEELGLPHRPEILTGDTAYGATELITELVDRGIEPHVPLLADEAPEEVPTWKRRTFNLERRRARDRKVKEVVLARNRVREVHRTRGYTVSRKLRIRSEHPFAEAKNEHGLRRARRRGRHQVEEQAKLSAIIQDLKRLVAFRGRTGPGAAAEATSPAPSRPGSWPQFAHLPLLFTHIQTIVTNVAFRLPFPGSPPPVAFRPLTASAL